MKYSAVMGPVLEKRKKFAVDPSFSVGGGKLTADAEERLEAYFMSKMKNSSLTEKGFNPEKIKDAHTAIRSILDSFSVMGDLAIIAESSTKEDLHVNFKQAKELGADLVSDFVANFYEKTYKTDINEACKIKSTLTDETPNTIMPQKP